MTAAQTVLTTVSAAFLMLVLPFAVAMLITYLRREHETRVNPDIRYNTTLLQGSIVTAGAMLLVVLFLSFFLRFENGQLRFSIVQGTMWEGIFGRSPFVALGAIVMLLFFASGGFILYLIFVLKPLVYRGEYERALRSVRGWKWLPVMRNVLDNLEGSILLFAGDYPAAERCFRMVEQRSLKSEPGPRGSNLGNLGWSLIRQGRYSEAVGVLQSSIDNYPEGADNFSAMAETLLWMGESPTEALNYLERGINNKRYKMNTDRYVWGELLANKAWALAQLGACDQARQLYNQALAETERDCIPALAGLHVRGAFALRLCGDEALAVEELNTAVKLDPHGAYGKMALEALEKQPSSSAIAQMQMQADAPTIVQAIKRNVPSGREIRVVRENVVVAVIGSTTSSVYLLRPLGDGSTQLQLIIHNAAAVQKALTSPDVKVGLADLIAEVKRTITESTPAQAQLQAIARQLQPPPQPVTPIQPLPEVFISSPSSSHPITPPPGTIQGQFDPAAVLGRKPLPKVTAQTPGRSGLGPQWYASMSIIMTPIVSGIILSTFWRRFGKPTWMWISLLCAILLPFVTIGAALLVVRGVPLGLPQMMVIALALGSNLGFVFGLGAVLEPAYKKWQLEGKEAVLNYPYKWGRGVLTGVGIAVAAVAVAIFAFISQPGPQKFENSAISLTYPGSWKTIDFSGIPDCKTHSECYIWVIEGRYGFTNAIIGRFSLGYNGPASYIEQNTWQNISQAHPNYRLESRDTLRINGVDAGRRYYFTTKSSSTSTDVQYVMQIYLVRNQYAYFITVVSENKAIFGERRGDIDQLVNSLIIKAP